MDIKPLMSAFVLIAVYIVITIFVWRPGSYVPNISSYQVPTQVPSEESLPSNQTQFLGYTEGIGRLGNWLFQYASALAIAARSNHTLFITEKNSLKKTFTGLSAEIINGFEGEIHFEQQAMTFAPRLLQLRGNVTLCCYLQSWKYFKGVENTIRQQFAFENAVQIGARKNLAECQSAYAERFNATAVYVGVHIRRGDVTSRSAERRGFVAAPLVYIQRAMQFYEDRFQHVVFVLVSDDHSWCEKSFKQLLDSGTACLPLKKSASEDLCMLSQCSHSIVTVGSFGWWSAFLAGGQVVYFNQWPRSGSEIASQIEMGDYFPPHWVGLK